MSVALDLNDSKETYRLHVPSGRQQQPGIAILGASQSLGGWDNVNQGIGSYSLFFYKLQR